MREEPFEQRQESLYPPPHWETTEKKLITREEVSLDWWVSMEEEFACNSVAWIWWFALSCSETTENRLITREEVSLNWWVSMKEEFACNSVASIWWFALSCSETTENTLITREEVILNCWVSMKEEFVYNSVVYLGKRGLEPYEYILLCIHVWSIYIYMYLTLSNIIYKTVKISTPKTGS